MANHLTPDELSKEVGIDRDEVIRICVEEHVPIYQGKIDKTLFQAQLEALGALPGVALETRATCAKRRRRACVVPPFSCRRPCRSRPAASSTPLRPTP